MKYIKTYVLKYGLSWMFYMYLELIYILWLLGVAFCKCQLGHMDWYPYLFYLIIFYCYSITVVLIFLPFSSSIQPKPLSSRRVPHCCHVHESFIHVLCLVPSTSVHHYPLPRFPLVTASLFRVSRPVVLLWPVVYCVH